MQNPTVAELIKFLSNFEQSAIVRIVGDKGEPLFVSEMWGDKEPVLDLQSED